MVFSSIYLLKLKLGRVGMTYLIIKTTQKKTKKDFVCVFLYLVSRPLHCFNSQVCLIPLDASQCKQCQIQKSERFLNLALSPKITPLWLFDFYHIFAAICKNNYVPQISPGAMRIS